jgi:hypothetical protein
MPGDTGIRPGTVPSNYSATSLISLVDQNTGATVFPGTLTAGSEYNLVAVIGNRGNADGGNYLTTPGTGIESSGIVMVCNTVHSPGVELPSLSNLDVADKIPIFEQYFLKSGQYDVVGFRLNVQAVYDGIIAAVNQAVSGGTLKSRGAHRRRVGARATSASLCEGCHRPAWRRVPQFKGKDIRF